MAFRFIWVKVGRVDQNTPSVSQSTFESYQSSLADHCQFATVGSLSGAFNPQPFSECPKMKLLAHFFVSGHDFLSCRKCVLSAGIEAQIQTRRVGSLGDAMGYSTSESTSMDRFVVDGYIFPAESCAPGGSVSSHHGFFFTDSN